MTDRHGQDWLTGAGWRWSRAHLIEAVAVRELRQRDDPGQEAGEVDVLAWMRGM